MPGPRSKHHLQPCGIDLSNSWRLFVSRTAQLTNRSPSTTARAGDAFVKCTEK